MQTHLPYVFFVFVFLKGQNNKYVFTIQTPFMTLFYFRQILCLVKSLNSVTKAYSSEKRMLEAQSPFKIKNLRLAS